MQAANDDESAVGERTWAFLKGQGFEQA